MVGKHQRRCTRSHFIGCLEGTLSLLVLFSQSHLQRSSQELWGEVQLCCLPSFPLGIAGHPACFQVFAVVSADTEKNLLHVTVCVPPGDARSTVRVVQSELMFSSCSVSFGSFAIRTTAFILKNCQHLVEDVIPSSHSELNC